MGNAKINPLDYDTFVKRLAVKCGADAETVTDSDQYAYGLVGLLRAIQLFDPSRGAKFTSFAYRVIWNQITESYYLRRRRERMTGVEILYEHCMGCDLDADRSEGRERDPAVVYEQRDESKAILKMMPGRARRLVRDRVMNGVGLIQVCARERRHTVAKIDPEIARQEIEAALRRNRMGYLKINNLYRDKTVLMFKELYALEKIHGTSAHVRWKDGQIGFFSGGVEYLNFVGLFDADALSAKFAETGINECFIYGEAYGGKCQGMKDTYGANLRFTAFDVKIGEQWLTVPKAEAFCQSFGIEFVWYSQTPSDPAELDRLRDMPSPQCRRVFGDDREKPMEGVVLRPLVEFTHHGWRVIAKHKRPEFSERASKKDTTLDPSKEQALADARAIADEWVTEMRLSHVMDKVAGELGRQPGIEETKIIITRMQADIATEAGELVVQSKAASREIGSATARMYKSRIMSA